MKNLRYDIFITILLSLIITSLIVFLGLPKINPVKNKSAENNIDNSEIQKNTNNREVDQKNNNSYNKTKNIDSLGSSSSSGGDSGSEDSDKDISLPNINAQPCGYHYVDYGICNGTCPKGVCVNEKRSCYCKEE